MKSYYKPLGKYIQPVVGRNNDLDNIPLMGLSIQKKFIPSIANTIGTDMSTYRIIEKNQFAYGPVTSRNGDKITIALFNDYEKALISQAYIPFEVKDNNELDPEYLMMWFRRPEFDRYARFKSHGSAREIFDWEELCNTLLAIPPITKQKEIINEYKTVDKRIKLNEIIIQKLEETAQTIYKHWFEDFEFPDENGNPYKSSGGMMHWDEELGKNIPVNWESGHLIDIAKILMGQSPNGDSYNNTGIGEILYQGRTEFGFRFPTARIYTTEPKRKAKEGDILMSVRAPVGDLNIANTDCCIGRGVASLRSRLNCNSHLFYLMKRIKSQFDISNDEGTIFGSITKDGLHNIKIIKPKNEVILHFQDTVKGLDALIRNLCEENLLLNRLKDLLFVKMTDQK
jgi:type I restriction enzyme, S subunit